MAKRKKKSTKASESKAKLDGDLKVKRADEETPDGVVLGEGGSIKNATVTVPAEEKKSRGFAEDIVSESAANQPIETPEVEVKVASKEVGFGEPKPFKAVVNKRASTKVACVAYGQRVTLKNARGYHVDADVVKIEEGMVTFRVLGSDAKLQKLEAEVLADLQRGGRAVRMEF